ncbi:Glu/Leu/Phe/Val dehydrogenase dimerization domain-containing protein [Hwanghaeella sp.]|uniref:Glu/Leu/Phe/Val dehydrogenase dimerization domain-containing protein n=1 Tax=Hwanghaeella sp. TaxID=2605943 RepID=UPI003CCBCE25
MSLFGSAHFDNHEQVVFCHDEASGLKAIIAVHNTNRGPALGGCRMWAYASEDDALTDVLRLSKGMTYKNALANLPYGGGKSVIIGDAKTQKTPAMMRAMGRMVDRLNGTYTIAEDVGTNPDDMTEIRRGTPHVKGVKGEGGDPSPATAYGVFSGIKASVKYKLGREDLNGLRVAVQGLGHVGYDLANQLRLAGAELVVTDIDKAALTRAEKELGAKVVSLDEIYDADVDIYAPCALGATLNESTIPRLKASIVAGSANNQLATDTDGDQLARRGILYAPDYVINAGGVIHIYHEGPDYDHDRAFAHVAGIGDVLLEVYALAESEALATHLAADRLAERRFRLDAAQQAA